MRKAMLLLTVFGLAGLVWAADPFVGTWKLNLEKSKFSPGPPPQSRTLKIAAQENGYKAVVDSVDSQGKPNHSEMALKYDGKDYPVAITGGPSDLTIATKIIDVNTHESVIKQGGKEVQTMREVVSRNGKILTRTTKRTNAQGQEVNNSVVFDKQ
jgi:hypothetical protein